MRPLAVAAITAFALPILSLACGGGGSTSGGGNTGGGGTGGITHPSWSRDVLPSIQNNNMCGGANNNGCHGNTGASGRIVYYFTEGRTAQTIYDSLVNQPAAANGWVLVKPGSPEQSWIHEKVTKSPPSVGSGMPIGGSFGTANTETLRNWIIDGALNN